MAGWVRLHRSITDHWVFEDAEFFRCWMLMIMDANHQTKKHMFNGSLMTIERGQFIFGLEAYNRKTGMTIARLRRLLFMLETEGMISRQKTNKFSLISIAKYEDYQSDDRQKTSQSQANDKPIATPKECKELQEGNRPDKPAAKATAAIGISKFLENCKETGADPIPETDTIFTYTSEAKIPDDFLHLYWLEFVERNKESGKRYKDWRSAFRNAVRGNWYKLWWLDGESYLLSTNGKQAEMKHKGSGRI
jgi:hypothetical protein